MEIGQILTHSATMWDALRNGGRFVAQQSKLRCATKIRNPL